MPGGDKTGPNGGGPKTGRGLGYCTDHEQPGYATDQPIQGSGRGFGRGGRGRGFGFRRGSDRFNANLGTRRGWMGFANESQEIEALKSETQELRSALQQILDKLDS